MCSSCSNLKNLFDFYFSFIEIILIMFVFVGFMVWLLLSESKTTDTTELLLLFLLFDVHMHFLWVFEFWAILLLSEMTYSIVILLVCLLSAQFCGIGDNIFYYYSKKKTHFFSINIWFDLISRCLLVAVTYLWLLKMRIVWRIGFGD